MMFDNQLAEMPVAKEIPLVDLEQKDLERLYENVFGVNPTTLDSSREALIAGLERPDEKRARLAELEQE